MEQRQLQLLKEVETANNELKDFAYIVSHDLKAPLRAITALAEWLSTDYKDKLDEAGKEQLNLLISRARRMHNLIDGILQYSRVGRLKEEKEAVDLNTLVSEVTGMIDPPENIDVEVVNELPTIVCEKTRMELVFENLLSNAVKYMDTPKGKITVGCTEEGGC
jgi:light-regulated signal transduction histidine kinase (bacteriophytochrome)